MVDEEIIWEGHADWRAWGGLTILGCLLTPVVIGIVILAVVWTRTRSKRWKITTMRVEVEEGWLSRTIETLELWRIRDIEFSQGLFDRMLRTARLEITAQDGQNPTMEVRGFPSDRSLYDKLMTAVMTSRQQRGIVNVTP